jgi:hypothetical protein
VDLDGEAAGGTEVRALEVPAPRTLLEITGPPDELVDRVAGLEWDEALPPLLFLRAVTDFLPPDLPSRLQDALSGHPEEARPALVELRQLRETELEQAVDQAAAALDTLTPAQVFQALLGARGVSGSDDLVAAFAQLGGMTEDDVEAECARIAGGEE